ncbi:hypothetical protein [Streptomyces sp. NPDC005141]
MATMPVMADRRPVERRHQAVDVPDERLLGVLEADHTISAI